MLLVRSSKYLSSLFFCKGDIGLVVCWCCFLKGVFLDDENTKYLKLSILHILKGVNSWFWSKFLNIFQDCFSIKETLVLSFDDVVFTKGGCLDDKYDILLQSKNLHILKVVNPFFWSEVPTIFRAYFSVTKTLILSFDDVVFSKGGFLDDKNDIFKIVGKFAYF